MSELMQASHYVHRRKQAGNVDGMREEWPYEQFSETYTRLLARSEYPDTEAVAAAAGFAASNISRWKSGKSRPTIEKLAALARALGVPAFVLWEAAGILPEGAASKLTGGLVEMPATSVLVVDGHVIPGEIERLAQLVGQLGPEDQDRLRIQLAMLIEWAEAALERGKT